MEGHRGGMVVGGCRIASALPLALIEATNDLLERCGGPPAQQNGQQVSTPI